MHELGITEEVVSLVCQRAGTARVRRVVLEIGRLTAVLPDAVRFCFDLCAADTRAEGAELEIVETPGRARCRQCEAVFALERPWGQCGCGGTDLEWLAGDELRVREIEVD
jgi:hydrogenase nickel incorporation protein HypA/HybF